jgi:hypothetical protein
MPKLSLAKLERNLYAATDILRPSMDAAEYKDFIYGMLFLQGQIDSIADGGGGGAPSPFVTKKKKRPRCQI